MTGAASSALRATLRAAPRQLQVAAVFPAAVYLTDPSSGRIVLTVVTADGIAHPNAVVLARRTAQQPFAGVRDHDPAQVGAHRLDGPWGAVRVTRWWSPQPVVTRVTSAALAAATVDATRLVGRRAPALPADEAGRFDVLLTAVAEGQPAAAVAAVDRLLGVGAGLTPTGDDLVAGLLAALQVVGPAVDAGPATTPTVPAVLALARADDPLWQRAVAAVAERIGERADHATTAISAALLRHAVRGEVCAPAAGLLRALTSASPALDRPLAELLRVGATSGRDLSLGVLAGTRLLAAVVSSTIRRPALVTAPAPARGTAPATATATTAAHATSRRT